MILASIKLRQSILSAATDLIRCGTRLYWPGHAGSNATFVNIMGAPQIGLGITCLYLLILRSLSLLILSAVALTCLGWPFSDEEFLLSIPAHLHAPLVVCCGDRHFLGEALCIARWLRCPTVDSLAGLLGRLVSCVDKRLLLFVQPDLVCILSLCQMLISFRTAKWSKLFTHGLFFRKNLRSFCLCQLLWHRLSGTIGPTFCLRIIHVVCWSKNLVIFELGRGSVF